MIPFDGEPLVEDGITYHSIENYYQAMKCADRADREYIATLEPKKSKTELKNPKYKLREGWGTPMKLFYMRKGIDHKFRLDTTWGQQLLATGKEDIVEWNNWNDTFWGKDVDTKKGSNWLGMLLKYRRQELFVERYMNESTVQS